MERDKILLIEDKSDTAAVLINLLRQEGYEVEHCSTGSRGLLRILQHQHDLVLLNANLQDVEGSVLCRQCRQQKIRTPIILIAMQASEGCMVGGLDAGADDYVARPLSARVLLARIKAQIRRSKIYQERNLGGANSLEPLSFADLLIDPRKRMASKAGDELDLTPIEFSILLELSRNAGTAFSRQDIMERVWDWDYQGQELNINSHISRLRAKIEDNPQRPRFVLTVRGVGYRFVEQEEIDREPQAFAA